MKISQEHFLVAPAGCRAGSRGRDSRLLQELPQGKKGFLSYYFAVGAGRTLAEHIWKRKRGDNHPNECAGDRSSSSGRIIGSLWFNMMIDHLCLPAYPIIVMKVEETHASQSSSSSPQKTENILVCQDFFIVKIHTRGPNPLTFFH